MTCQLVELGSFNPSFTYFYQLEHQICKIEAAKSRAGVSAMGPMCSILSGIVWGLEG